jgi:hypothetical protein
VWRAEVVADSLNTATGDRITTIVATYPRIPVHEHLLTHSMLRRNSRSNRVVSTKKMAEFEPYRPERYYEDARRMQPGNPISGRNAEVCEAIWQTAYANALQSVSFFDQMGVHREIANRLLEPFKPITSVFTSTDWPWFFRVRCAEDQPVQSPTRKIARMMLEAFVGSVPKKVGLGGWHLPFVSEEEVLDIVEDGGEAASLATISAARCARVSALTFEGKHDYAADVDLHNRLVASNEWSPLEHPAQAHGFPERRGSPYRGWTSYRSIFPGSYDPSPLTPAETARLLGRAAPGGPPPPA